MVTGHNNSPLLILSVMSPFQTVLFKIYENNYTSNVEKRFIVNDFITILIDATLTSPKK